MVQQQWMCFSCKNYISSIPRGELWATEIFFVRLIGSADPAKVQSLQSVSLHTILLIYLVLWVALLLNATWEDAALTAQKPDFISIVSCVLTVLAVWMFAQSRHPRSVLLLHGLQDLGSRASSELAGINRRAHPQWVRAKLQVWWEVLYQNPKFRKSKALINQTDQKWDQRSFWCLAIKEEGGLM